MILKLAISRVAIASMLLDSLCGDVTAFPVRVSGPSITWPGGSEYSGFALWCSAISVAGFSAHIRHYTACGGDDGQTWIIQIIFGPSNFESGGQGFESLPARQ